MAATIIARTPTSFTLQVEVPYNDSMLDFEEALQQRLNDAGVVATAEGLKQFDTDGSPITVGAARLTSKGPVEKDYQTPYGVATVARHVYQSNQGGATYCPLDRDARIVVSSTPRFAKVLSHKYAEFSSPRAQVDLEKNHGRSVSRCLIQDVADAVAAAVLAKEEAWGYALPKFEEPPTTVAVSLDGTCLLMGEEGWRETMVGTLSFYDREGERQHTIYLAATPEYGKAKFLGRLEAEIDRAKAKCPDARYVGIADGAKGNWEFLGRHTDVQVTDFWHAVEYLGKAAVVLYRGQPQSRKAWLDEACHRLKHEPGGAGWVLKRLRSLARERPWAKGDEDVRSAITYFANQSEAGRMDYAARVAAMEPIGSGVTEAACKVIVKQRLCGSGMKWTEDGAAVVLSLRALSYTPERWDQFWSKVDRWGFPVAA
ncbi:MAG TPA: ISKra4 family transposase [Isosphaeraceae bacterium]|nr:ISKra4 family transposase [Isosphaeraceae bacterium]